MDNKFTPKIEDYACSLRTQYVREMLADENDLLNFYRQMSPEYKSVFYAQATQLLDRQIENGHDDARISDDSLFYFIEDEEVNQFYSQCDFLEPEYNECIVIALERNFKYLRIYGFVHGIMSLIGFVNDDMDIFIIKEYIYDNIKTPAQHDKQLIAQWFFKEVSYHEFVESRMYD